ncbi:MAG TPA: SRPBCC family protein [Polyangia bacterium]|jgi:hypothetical protein
MHLEVTAETAANPEQVLALAGTNFSEQRAEVWTNVDARRLAVHERGATHVEVTEYATGIAWFAWERTRYDWSEPGLIKQVVLDSNVLQRGSWWELRVNPRAGGGSEVRMTFARRFRRSFNGAFAYLLNHLLGRRGWGWYLRSALKAVERASPSSAASTRMAAAGSPKRMKP